MALDLDTSCLLKVFPEPETAVTMALIARESHAVVSSLARLEALVHIHGRVAASVVSHNLLYRDRRTRWIVVSLPAGALRYAAKRGRLLRANGSGPTLQRFFPFTPSSPIFPGAYRGAPAV